MAITADEFDACYPGNERWEEGLDAINNGFCDLHWDSNGSAIFEVSGEESEIEDFFSIYDLTNTFNFKYRIWKAKGNSAELVKLKNEAIDELGKKLQRQKNEITQFMSEVKPIWDMDEELKTESIFEKFFNEYMTLTNSAEEA